MLRLHGMVFGEANGPASRAEASYLPLFGHLALVLIGGVYLPEPLVIWFQNVAKLLG
jgi:hydrogenase-4 component F